MQNIHFSHLRRGEMNVGGGLKQFNFFLEGYHTDGAQQFYCLRMPGEAIKK